MKILQTWREKKLALKILKRSAGARNTPADLESDLRRVSTSAEDEVAATNVMAKERDVHPIVFTSWRGSGADMT